MTDALWHSALVITVVCLLGSWLQYRLKNASHADVIWAASTGLASLYYLLIGTGAWLPRVITALLLLTWSMRLSGHILQRLMSEAEDGRYAAMREHYGAGINRFHVVFFLGQGLLAWCFALPAWVIACYPQPLHHWPLWLGASLGVAALLGEWLADQQLATFRADKRHQGTTCRHGLWRYSRHPNYFFEWLHWLAYPLIAWGIPLGAWLWLAPLLMLLFIWFVSGIPFTEMQALKSRGDDYRHYQQTTSVFFPWRYKS